MTLFVFRNSLCAFLCGPSQILVAASGSPSCSAAYGRLEPSSRNTYNSGESRGGASPGRSHPGWARRRLGPHVFLGPAAIQRLTQTPRHLPHAELSVASDSQTGLTSHAHTYGLDAQRRIRTHSYIDWSCSHVRVSSPCTTSPWRRSSVSAHQN